MTSFLQHRRAAYAAVLSVLIATPLAAQETPAETTVIVDDGDPGAYLAWLSEAGIEAVCGHIETLPYPMRFLKSAHRLGMKAGLAMNLKVPVHELTAYTEELDYVLVMTSEPDGGEQEFFSCAYGRVAQLREMLPERVKIWCDGGIRPEYLPELHRAGMDVAIMGRAVFLAADPVQAVEMYERSAT